MKRRHITCSKSYTFIGSSLKGEAVFCDKDNNLAIEKDHQYLAEATPEEDAEIRGRMSFLKPATKVPSQFEVLTQINKDLLKALFPIANVYEKFKHLDAILSDEVWIDGGTPSPQRRILFDLWQAVRSIKDLKETPVK